MKKKGMPTTGELVICRITNVNPNSAFARLEEYEMEGMIHISEVRRGWVRDIRNHVKVGDNVVAKVIKVSGTHVSLSLKRVDDMQKSNKMKEYKLAHKAEKMLEIAAKEMNTTLQKAYDKIGFKLIDQFGSLYDAFKTMQKNPKLVEEILPKDWFDKIKDVVEKNIEVKEFEFRANLTLKTTAPDGIKTIKEILKSAKTMGLDVHYISAPVYMIKYKTKDAKKGEKDFTEKLKKMAATKGVKADFEMIK